MEFGWGGETLKNRSDKSDSVYCYYYYFQNQGLFLKLVCDCKRKILNKEKVETFVKIIETFSFFRRDVYKTAHIRNNIFASDKRIIKLHIRTMRTR